MKVQTIHFQQYKPKSLNVRKNYKICNKMVYFGIRINHFFMRQNYIVQLEEISRKLKEIQADNIIDKTQKSIHFLETKLAEVNNWLRDYNFVDEAAEIHFFKHCKAKIVSQLYYNQILLDIHLKIITSKKKKKDNYTKQLEKFTQIPKGYNKLWRYYQSSSTKKDREYFLRENNQSDINDQYSIVFIDERTTTKMEYPLAKLMAREQIVYYLETELDALEQEKPHKALPKSNLEWTGTNLDLIELIYALHHNKIINGGKKEVKEIAKVFGNAFNIDLEDNIYRYYIDIKRRKKEKTPFLNSMAATLNKVIESEQ